MTAFLKIDRCRICQQEVPWEWVPSIPLFGRPFAGTGVWRSQLTHDLCPACLTAMETRRLKEKRTKALEAGLTNLLGGEKPYREFTFERYELTPGNQLAFEKAKGFDPSKHSLYFWGPCGVGKTHLGSAIARLWFEQGRSVELVRPPQLMRKVRKKEPEAEQEAIDHFVQIEVFVLDELGVGQETAFARQVFQEILDGRDFRKGEFKGKENSADTASHLTKF